MAAVAIEVPGDIGGDADQTRRLACAAIAFAAAPDGQGSNVTLDVAEEIRKYVQENHRPSQD